MGASPKFSCPIPASLAAFSFSRCSRSRRCLIFLASFSALAAAFASFLALFLSEASCGAAVFLAAFLGGP